MSFQPRMGPDGGFSQWKCWLPALFETWATALDPDLGTYIVYWGPPLGSDSAPSLSKLASMLQVSQFSRVWLFVTPWTAARQASLSITNSRSLLKLMSIESVMPSNHLILCRPRLLLHSILPSITVFSNESVLCIKWPKYWSFSFSISPSNEYSGLISFRMDWFDLLAVQGTLKSLLQHHFASGRGRKKFLMEAEWVCSKGPLTGRAGYQVTLVQLWPGLHLCLDLT